MPKVKKKAVIFVKTPLEMTVEMTLVLWEVPFNRFSPKEIILNYPTIKARKIFINICKF